MSDIYVRFKGIKNPDNPDDFGTWYRLIERSKELGRGDDAVLVYPTALSLSNTRILTAKMMVGARATNLSRTEFTEDEVPDELWQRIALQELGISNTTDEEN